MSATWVRLCRLDELEPDRPLGRVVGNTGQDRDRVCVIRHDDAILAVLDRCPHRDVALSGGIVKEGHLVCPGHFWRFDLRTGQRPDEPSTGLLRYDTRVVDGWIEALLADPSPRVSMRELLLNAAASPVVDMRERRREH